MVSVADAAFPVRTWGVIQTVKYGGACEYVEG